MVLDSPPPPFPGTDIEVLGQAVHVHDVGSGPPVILLHGSGPGTTALGAWGPVAAVLSGRHRVLAPDFAGFGHLATPGPFGRARWTGQVLGVLDALGISSCAVVGNSMGGAIALSVAHARPDLVTRVVAVGSLGVAMPLPDGLDALWSYEPSRENARALQHLLVGDPATVTDEAVETRLQATLEPRARAAFPTLFPPPRERWVRDLVLEDSELAGIRCPVLAIHGSEDRVVPLRDSALRLLHLLPDVRLHVFGGCGHATPVERPVEFRQLLTSFLGGP